ncbi:helix-turn-helix domain-containing protein [Paraburkholderia youngii]|uniref:helix-turn-helix domain-containing protein n=2 Tax=Paraburkholderia youngii TaxID=2782701 RepID=UPI003D1950EE
MQSTRRNRMARFNATTTVATLNSILNQLPGKTARRQRERLLSAPSQLGSVTTVDATRFLDVIDPRARIFELRSQGYHIGTTSVAHATECGVFHTVGRYVLLPGSTTHRGRDGWVQLTLPLIGDPVPA